jgi:hypothetical protein
MGGGLCGGCATNHQNGEIFEPPYLFNASGEPAARPAITQGPATADVGASLIVSGTDNIQRFTMVRLAALTHHYTSDQRLIPLEHQKTGTGSYTISLPGNPNVVIPGNYWIFALDSNGVPSTGHSLQVQTSQPEVTAVPDFDPAQAAVNYEYFEGSWNNLPDFDSLTPVKTGRFPVISLSPKEADDFYGFRFTTDFEVPASGAYTFYLTSDDGSALFINGQQLIDNDGIHGALEQVGIINLPAGTHSMEVTFFERSGGDSLLVDVSGPGITRQSVTPFLLSSTPPLAPAATPVDYEYYEGDWQALPDFNALTPVQTGQLRGISLSPKLQNDFYGFRFNTTLNVTTAGDYTFYLTSDDGSALYIDDALIIDNDGLHGARERTNTVALTEGQHTLQVTLFERTGGDSLEVNVSGQGITRQSLTTLLTDPNDPVDPVDPVDPADPVDPITPVPPVSGGLLVNGGFENGLENWTVCGGSDGISLASQPYSGNASLSLTGGGCLYQEIPVTPTDSVALECFANTGNSGYASMSLSIDNGSYETLANQEVQITTTDYSAYNTTLVADAEAAFAIVVLYSDANAGFDHCQVAVNGSTVNTQPPAPEPVAPTGNNLLTNGGFETALDNWQACTTPNAATITSEAAEGNAAAALAATTCLFQQVPVTTTGNATIACQAARNGSSYTSLALSFSDAAFGDLGLVESEVTSPAYAITTASAPVPDSAAYATLTLYSEGNATVDACQLVINP